MLKFSVSYDLKTSVDERYKKLFTPNIYNKSKYFIIVKTFRPF